MEQLQEWLPSIFGLLSVLYALHQASMKIEKKLGEVSVELKSLHEFASESRKDRDLLRGDIKELRTDISGNRERIVRVETHAGLRTSHGG